MRPMQKRPVATFQPGEPKDDGAAMPEEPAPAAVGMTFVSH